MSFKYGTLIFDVETNGLLDRLDRVHVLVIREYESGRSWTFRRNNEMDNIAKGVRMLMNCEELVGHNIMQFDIEAIKLVYDWFEVHPDTLISDTLVMARLIFTDQKDKDFRLWKRGKLPGQHIGGATLESWGYRLGLQKGDYKEEREEKAKTLGIFDEDEITEFVWGTWNQEMEEYCELDVDVNTLLWTKIVETNYPDLPIDLEHQAHEMAIMIEENGFPFDRKGAKKLADGIAEESARLQAIAEEHFGFWFAPKKKRVVAPLWEGQEYSKGYQEIRPEFGEDDSRAVWGEVTVAKTTRKFKQMYRENKKTGEKILNNSVEAGAMFCQMQIKEFKPTSRPQIIDRFTTVYNWEPIDFTEKGNPEVNDDVLRGLIGKIPMAEELAEVFYLEKRLSQIATGTQGWLKKVEDDNAIHHRLNTGGTVSGRCSHSSPNIAQVPKVLSAKVLDDEGNINKKFLDVDGQPMAHIYNEDGTYAKTAPLLGREGKHGFECRSLFYVPKGWRLVGCDLSGIELRCLANVAAPFDDGFLINQILDGDIHTANQEAAGLASRDTAKTFIYALIYGAGDAKIGSIVEPLASVKRQAELGKYLKAQFFEKMPGLAAAVKQIQKQAKRGWVEGLDGRRLMVRAKHSALNLRLQSDGAVIAKKWMINSNDAMLDLGWKHGWDGDYAFLAFVHDELQVAVREGLQEPAKTLLIGAAADAGEYFDFAMKVDAEAKDGMNWAETH